MIRYPGMLGALLLAGGCANPIVKEAALDPVAWSISPAADLVAEAGAERVISTDPAWLADVDPKRNLIFASCVPASSVYQVVVRCEPVSDRLELLPLDPDQSPVDIARDATLRRRWHDRVLTARRKGHPELRALSLRATLEGGHMRAPIRPGRVYAVAANFPSHLEHDLAITLTPEQRARLSAARARVFLKFPATAPAGRGTPPATTIAGPFDPMHVNAVITLPAIRSSSPPPTTISLDYETEIGVVIGRDLTWEETRSANDATLAKVVAGLVLVSDTKARNPQVVDKVADEDRAHPPSALAYAVGDRALDRALGSWDRPTCLWWSYAASTVDTAIGPFMVVPIEGPVRLDQALIGGRSYGRDRGQPIPDRRETDTLYVRQATRVTADTAHADALLWDIPAIIRSILDPQDNALHFRGPVGLAAGDVICLGTPGGVVLTSKPAPLFSFLHDLMFWWSPRKWHDVFFERDAALYLHPGDRVFHWAAGLGYQEHSIESATD